MHTFETPNAVNLKITSGAGTVDVDAEHTTTSRVEMSVLGGGDQAQEAIDAATVEQRGDDLVVELPRPKRGLFGSGRVSVAVTVTVPAGSSARVQTESADVATQGDLHRVEVKTGSGEVRIDSAVLADLQSGSGGVEVHECTERLTVKTGSGDVEIDRAAERSEVLTGSGDVEIDQMSGALTTKTGSGDVQIGILAGDLVTKTGSGDLTVRRAQSGSVNVAGASGEVAVGVEPGTAVWLDANTVTGDVVNQLDDVDAPEQTDARLELRAKTATGDIVVRRA